jgi:hypothetical protein
MNFRFRSLTVTALGLGALAFAAGCEVSKCETEEGNEATCAESLERYTRDGSDTTAEQPYEDGMDLVIDSVKGNIEVVPGDPGVVVATFSPFTYRGHSKDAEAGEDITSGWSGEVVTEGNQITVITYQLGGWDEVGANIKVWVPPEFNGAIKGVIQAEGSIESEGNISFEEGAVGSAWSAHLESYGLAGTCNLDGSPTITETYASCEGEIEITNVSDNVTALSTGMADDADPYRVRVSFAAISETATGGEMRTEQGHIELNMPSEGNFQVTAAPNEDGVFNLTGAPDACESSDTTVSCGTGAAVFLATAGTDDSLDPGNVNVDFH